MQQLKDVQSVIEEDKTVLVSHMYYSAKDYMKSII